MTATELLEICMDLNAPDFSVLFYYYGHAEPHCFSLAIVPNGFNGGGKAVSYEDGSGFSLIKYDELEKASEWLRQNHDDFRSKQ